jgi:uncharacterized peroxidase-related enzyme
MRLATMNAGYGLTDRVRLATLQRFGGPAIADAARTFLYRADWGRPFLALAHSLLRGSSGWTIAERELFATLVSSWNRCSYCVSTHGAVARRGAGDDVIDRALADWRSAPMRPPTRAMVAFLEKMTLTPRALASTDADAVRRAGATDDAIRQAMYIGWWFNVANRTADAYGLSAPSAHFLPGAVRFLSAFGYRL